jgi:hypothetical protein
MAEYSKESLEKLLTLIDEICKKEENFWFKESLMTLLLKTETKSDIIIKLKAIEKYLKIDGLEIIDYSNISNEKVRNQLFRDSVEMSKYRLGKINDTINFDEFCRYAHLQAEELINYYYSEKFYGNLYYVKEFILKHLPTYKLRETITSLNEINYSSKLSAFIKEYKLEKGQLKSTLEFLSNLRNELSHRNSNEINDDGAILTQIQIKNLDVSSSYINYSLTSKEDQKLFTKGRFIYLKRKQDYNEILVNLNYLKEAILLVIEK